MPKKNGEEKEDYQALFENYHGQAIPSTPIARYQNVKR